jgi:hypothetical protein
MVSSYRSVNRAGLSWPGIEIGDVIPEMGMLEFMPYLSKNKKVNVTTPCF